MLLSIIIPSFQQGGVFKEALKSIEQQTFKNYEILVIDAESKDDTAEVISQFKDLPITFYSEPDRGIYDAMNKGIALSTGQYLYFMGCDDRLASDTVLADIFERPGITDNHVIYGDVIFTEDGTIYDGEFTQFELIKRNICHQAIFTRREVFNVLGDFDIRYKTYADWEFNMRWFKEAWVKRQYLPLIVSYFNTNGFSSNREDNLFFADELKLKKKYFSALVRYLAFNLEKPLHYRIMKLLTPNRLFILNSVVANFNRIAGK
jgi:glycosyltransferase involved in cell wall biosynthesis